eukprot:360643-Chlamydomonas_euryale.AAC.11
MFNHHHHQRSRVWLQLADAFHHDHQTCAAGGRHVLRFSHLLWCSRDVCSPSVLLLWCPQHHPEEESLHLFANVSPPPRSLAFFRPCESRVHLAPVLPPSPTPPPLSRSTSRPSTCVQCRCVGVTDCGVVAASAVDVKCINGDRWRSEEGWPRHQTTTGHVCVVIHTHIQPCNWLQNLSVPPLLTADPAKCPPRCAYAATVFPSPPPPPPPLLSQIARSVRPCATRKRRPQIGGRWRRCLAPRSCAAAPRSEQSRVPLTIASVLYQRDLLELPRGVPPPRWTMPAHPLPQGLPSLASLLCGGACLVSFRRRASRSHLGPAGPPARRVCPDDATQNRELRAVSRATLQQSSHLTWRRARLGEPRLDPLRSRCTCSRRALALPPCAGRPAPPLLAGRGGEGS